MSIDKKEIIEQHGANEKDSGSTKVQVALLTERIKLLTAHLKTHKKDYSTRRSLLKLAGQRRRFLRFLKRKDLNGYTELLEKLGIRGV